MNHENPQNSSFAGSGGGLQRGSFRWSLSPRHSLQHNQIGSEARHGSAR